ncbi:MAG: hypothetical protein GY814_02840, partial [Gammaproteobacteria bacterium]|nr:hypothetical protein [Gammaproteobacteria bacterium]
MTSTTHTYTGYYDPTTGKGHSGQMMKFAQGLEIMVYWSASFPFINVIKGGYTSNSAIPGTLDAQGYPDASGGGHWSHYTHTTTNFMNEGTVDNPWVLRWVGTGNVTWNGGTEIPGSTPNRREYTSLAVPTNTYWTVATGDVRELELLAPGEEARYDAGNILHSRFVADLAGIDSVRLMDPLSTNDSPNRDDSDFTPYDYINWNLRRSPNGLAQVNRGLPIQAACEVANELDASLHHNIPHQATDAAVTYIGQQIALHFDFSGGKKVKIELGNEPWNPGVGFSDAWAWFWFGSQSPQEGTFDPTTATCTSTAHELTTGDEIISFHNIYHKNWPYAAGGGTYAIVDDVNTFRCAVTEAAALRGADVLDDTDADHKVSYIPHESATFLRFKPAIVGGVYTAGGYYAERAMQVWDLIAAEIGEETMEVVAGCRGSDANFMLQQLEVPDYRERVMKSGQ